jgi:L-rhamnose-H+ transport protein
MFTGMLLAVLSGVCLGVCFLPMRYMTKFAWENTWFVWVISGCLIFPPIIAYLTIPSFLQVLAQVGLRLNLIMLGVGLVAGMSGICIGRAIGMVGITLTNSLSNGVALTVGAFVPLVIQHREALHGKVGMSLIAGLGLGALGVVILAIAGARRKQASAYMKIDYKGGSRMMAIALTGIILSITSGLLTPLQNFGIAFGGQFMKVAQAHGASEAFMTFAFYVPYLGTSFVSNGIYCAHLWKKNGSLRQFREPGGLRFTAMGVGMAVVWMCGMMFYGWAMPYMKTYGPVIGWPVMLASINLASAAVEYCYGDWKGEALRVLGYGLLVLTLSIAMFAYSNLLIQKLII